MNRPKFPRAKSGGSWRGLRYRALFGALLGVAISLGFGSRAATNTNLVDEIPPLMPPRGELPPTYWERHGQATVWGGAAVVIFGGLAAWWALRPRPAVAIPIEVETREALESLRDQPESGETLSRVSQTLRHYAARAFELPSVEMTTAEFCLAMQNSASTGPALADAFAEFLRRADERKFTARGPGGPQGTVARALELVAQGESRREELRRAATAAASKTGAKS